MADKDQKRSVAWQSARDIYARLMALPREPASLSNNDWAKRAGVSTSFFTNLRGSDTKPPSEPSVSNLRAVLRAAGSSLPEFFADEAEGRLVKRPTRQVLARAIYDALPRLPQDRDRRAEYLAEAVLNGLELPEELPGSPATEDDSEEDVHVEAAPARAATS